MGRYPMELRPGYEEDLLWLAITYERSPTVDNYNVDLSKKQGSYSWHEKFSACLQF